MSVTFGDIKIGATSAVDSSLVVTPQEPVVPEIDALIPTSTEKTEMGFVELDGGVKMYTLINANDTMIYYAEMGSSKGVNITSGGNSYSWACDEDTAEAQGIDAYKWYLGATEYTGSSPISASDFNSEDIKSESYLNRVIASFSNN
jgi:hypothetical protein